MQITDLAVEQKITPILRLGFRPFFLAGSIFSLLALVLWGLILAGSVTLTPYGGGYWWHIHEMVFGFGCAIVVGFLLTAVQNWTGIRGVSGKPLFFLAMLWLAGRLALLLPTFLNSYVIMLIDLSFLPVAAYLLAKPIIKIKQQRNLFFVPLLGLFTLANIETYLVNFGVPGVQLSQSAYASVMLVTFLMSVMAGRVTPMFTANGTKTAKVDPIPWLERLTNGSLALITLLYLLHPFFTVPAVLLGGLFVVASVFQAARWIRWRPWITLNVPLLWSIHFSLFFIWFGLFMIGFTYLNGTPVLHHIWHLLTIGGMGGLILAMIARVSLGHTGRTLVAPNSMKYAFACIFIGALVRSLGPVMLPAGYSYFINSGIVLWVVGFGLFAWNYAPMLMSPRVDGRPG